MVNTKFYTAIYVVLFVSATVQVLVEFAGLDYWMAFGIIIALSAAKAILVAAYFQHLRWEPRSLTYLIGIGLTGALALTIAASYSLL
ncbi:cytochrome C oxidase subunit IV family protein [Haloferax sp. DFSO60]|uniref:cytochrome C oxidase subunit IV family protein n=1 Tax=Haloferax sp. DFSO60 TaxID=3388652 RepID=UPI00397D960C